MQIERQMACIELKVEFGCFHMDNEEGYWVNNKIKMLLQLHVIESDQHPVRNGFNQDISAVKW